MAFRPMNVLLDTAAWINAVKEPETLPAKALALLRNEANDFFLSDISLLEASTLERKQKVDFGMELTNGWKRRWRRTYRFWRFPPVSLPSRTPCREHFMEIPQTASARVRPSRIS